MEHEAAAQIQLEFQARGCARGEHPQVDKGRLRYWRLCLRRSARRGGECPPAQKARNADRLPRAERRDAQPAWDAVAAGALAVIDPDGVFCVLAAKFVFDQSSFGAMRAHTEKQPVAITRQAVAALVGLGGFLGWGFG